MDINELIAAYNKAIQEGMNSEQFANSMGMQRKSLQQKARRAGYVFEKEKNQYVLKESLQIQVTRVQETEEKKSKNQEDGELKKIQKELLSLQGRIEKLEQERVQVAATSEIKSTELPLREFKTPVKQISYRYHTDVLEALERVCKRYPYYTKHAIINSLLMEALDQIDR